MHFALVRASRRPCVKAELTFDPYILMKEVMCSLHLKTAKLKHSSYFTINSFVLSHCFLNHIQVVVL